MTNAKIFEHGQMLFQSAENLRRSAASLQGMMDSLWDEIEKKKFSDEFEYWGDEEITDNKGWMTTAYAYNVGVLSCPERAAGQRGPSKKPKQIGSVSIIARLCNSRDIDGEQHSWPWLNQACLIVGWHSKQNLDDHWEPDDHWEIGHFEPEDENMASIVHVANGLWAWRGDEVDYSYFFVLPIFALTNEDDLKRFALRPAKTLFNADDPKALAQETFREVPVLFPSE